MSKARWTEFVAEYGNLEEVKNVFALEQQTIENYEIKINKKFTLKSLFTNKAYAVDVDGIKTYYPVKGSRYNVTEATLQKTICYEEGINEADLGDISKVNLYEVDLSLLPSISGVKRKYVINIVSGNLYSIDKVKYEGLIYHTPRYGVREENEPEKELIIHYRPNAEGEVEQTQKVKISNSGAVTLTLAGDMFNKQGFIHWKDVTDRENSESETEDDEEEGNPQDEFVLKTEGYYGIVNGLKDILGDEEWEENIFDIIDTYENQSDKLNEIVVYLDPYRTEINEKLSNSDVTNKTLNGLASWMLSDTEGTPNIEYLTGLEDYQGESEEEVEEDTNQEPEVYKTYNDGETVNMAGNDMILEAEWGEAVTLVANVNNNGATVNGKGQDVIGVKIGDPYGDMLVDADTRAGYVFYGWWTDPTDESNPADRIYADDIYDSSKPSTLYAHWVLEGSAEIVTVTYNAKDGGKIKGTNEQTKVVKKVKNDKLGTLPIAVAGEMEFKNQWYDELTGGNKVNGATPVTKDITLYSQWVGVELDPKGGSFATKYKVGTSGYNKYFSKWNPVEYSVGTIIDKTVKKEDGIIRWTRKEGYENFRFVGHIFVADGQAIGQQAGNKQWQLPLAWKKDKNKPYVWNKTLRKMGSKKR